MPDLIPLRDAVDSISARTPIGSVLRSADWARVPVALRQRAQFSAGVESARLLQSIQDRLQAQIKLQREQLANGKTATFDRSSFIDEIRRIAREEGLTPQDPSKAGGLQDITSIPRLGLIYDMQNSMAQGHARWKLDQSEGALLLWPAQEFVRVEDRQAPRQNWPERFAAAAVAAGDDQALAAFQASGRMIALKTSGLWAKLSRFDVPWPPFDFQSGMGLEDVDRDTAVELGLMGPADKLQPAEADFNEQLQASVAGLDGELTKFLKESFGDQVKVEGDTVWWKGDRKGKALARPKSKEEPAPAAEVPDAPAPKPEPSGPAFPANLAGLETVRGLGGSTGATLVVDRRTGRRYVLKRGNSADHVREEFAADQIYRAAGAAVPEARLYEEGGRPAKLAEFIEGRSLADYLRGATEEQRAATLRQLGEHFAVDALVGNWDVAGLDLDNILVDAAGKPWRIDNGGALRYRAQGTAKKPTEWDGFATELWSLRDPEANEQTASAFAGLSIYDIARQLEKLDRTKILEAAPEAVRGVIEARLVNLLDISRKATEYERTAFKAGYADGVTRQMMNLRKEGITDRLPTALSQAKAGDVHPKDPEGRTFNHLRTLAQEATASADPSQTLFDAILPAVKTINGHHAKGDIQYNAPKIQAALGKKPQLEGLALTGTPQQKAMANHYLAVLSQIEKAQGNLVNKVDQFTKFPLPATPAGKRPISTVAALADYMAANGADWSIISEWASDQGGSSGSHSSLAVKRWLLDRMQAKEDEFRNAPAAGPLNQKSSQYGRTKYDRTLEMFHAFVQELLARTAFVGNDRDARMVRVIRIETDSAAVPFGKGKSGEYKRGINESGSVFRPVAGWSGTRTITATPHTRITGIYFLEQQPGSGSTFFFGDSENEVTYIGHGLKAFNAGKSDKDVSLEPGAKRADWEI